MTKEQKRKGFLVKFIRKLRGIWRTLRYGWSHTRVAFRNRLRILRRLKLDYVVIPVSGSLPERDRPPRSFIQRQLPFPPDPLSMEALNHRLRCIADASNVKGVILVFQGLSAGTATLQNLRQSIERLQSAGKECVVFTPYLNMTHYFAASAADRIVVPPSATFDVLGLHSEAVFLKDALTRLGIQADVLQISPYKGAFDALDKTDITPEQEEQINWLLDEGYDLMTAAIAGGRKMDQEEVKSLIDQAPMTAEQALEAGLVDDLAYEDTLPFLLEEPAGPAGLDSAEEAEKAPDGYQKSRKPPAKAKLATWSRARKILLEKYRQPTSKYIGVVSLEGTIVMGPSRRPPIPMPIPLIGGNMAGEESIVRLLRGAEKDRQMGALIFHVDSGGGAALASDLIWRQLDRIAQKKPVLVYMGNVAASGGYYVGAAAQHIMAQSLTITGSIGVITLHVNTAGLYEMLSVNRRTFSRGERAMLYADDAPLSAEGRQALWDTVQAMYAQFKKVVADGRDIAIEELDPICEGRVWSGRQAIEHNLIDSIGDFEDAVKQAADLAGMRLEDNQQMPVYNLHSRGRRHILPNVYEPAEELARQFSLDHLRNYSDRPLIMMPFEIRFW